jgi:anti-anti-sigma factor
MTTDSSPTPFRIIGPDARAGALLVRLEGELEYGSVPAFQEATGNIASNERLLIDLRALDFIDSFGLGALVKLHARMIKGGGTLGCLMAAQSLPRRLFELTGLDDLFELIDTPPDEPLRH